MILFALFALGAALVSVVLGLILADGLAAHVARKTRDLNQDLKGAAHV